MGRMLPTKHKTLNASGFNGGSNFSSANSNLGSNSLLPTSFIMRPQIDQRQLMMSSADVRDDMLGRGVNHELLTRQGSIDQMNSDSFSKVHHPQANYPTLADLIKMRDQTANSNNSHVKQFTTQPPPKNPEFQDSI